MNIESKDENKKSRYISKKTISMILEKYKYKCANNPNNPVIKDYYCPMWLLYNGDFDISRYEIDHIEEYSLTGDNSIDNLQPLCPSCHTVKTKKFLKNKCVFTSSEINHRRCFMEV
jgi:CRISPR/Cas system Type II protein with McrA/HNH and RuvC-like nuclease domain